MRKSSLIVGVVGIVLVVASISWSELPTTTRDTLQEDNAKLRAENERLKARVSDLERQLARQRVTVRTLPPATQPFDWKIDPEMIPPNLRYRLERDPNNPRFRIAPRSGTTRPSAPLQPYNFIVPDDSAIPRDWIRKEFNGQPFYIIPLGTTQTSHP